MRGVFYIREVSTGDTRSIDSTGYETKESAAHVILRHLQRGSIKKGWVVDELEHTVLSAEDAFDLFKSTQTPS
jgi:hypothetical protein